MTSGAAQPPSRRSLTGGRPVPGAAKLGALVIGFGLLFDLVEHTLVTHAHESAVAGFPVGEHLAHLVVLVGMVVVLVGVIADGMRQSGRQSRPEGSSRDAIR